MEIHGEGCVIENIESFFSSVNSLELEVTQNSGASKDLSDLLTKLKETEKDSLLGTHTISLRKLMDRLRDIIDSETGIKYSYTVERKRIDTQMLLNNVGSLLSSDVYETLPILAKDDLKEAGKCIAFNLPTASAFHLMRTVESTLRELYFKNIKRNRLARLEWGPMEKALESKRGTRKPDAALIEHLKHIRKSFRNPTQHPDATYDIEQAQDLFNLCIDVLNRMSKELSK
ncbi:MAG: hypothetical protein KBC16_02010 [Candidatus Pacebacteria bacterium]|nr:hypothetical protein [Candidatus Paceibacterota bacterium]